MPGSNTPGFNQDIPVFACVEDAAPEWQIENHQILFWTIRP